MDAGGRATQGVAAEKSKAIAIKIDAKDSLHTFGMTDFLCHHETQ